MPRGGLGRFGEPAAWVLVALRRGPSTADQLLEAVRAMDGPVGPGTLVATLARLQARRLIARDASYRPAMYRLTNYQREGA